MKKKLIVSGCSFTTDNFISSGYPNLDCSWTKWPKLLAEKLNMEVINLGLNGAGNRYILQTLVETIEKTPKEEIGLVIAAWSQSNRDDWQEYKKFISNKSNDRYLKNFQWRNKRLDRVGDVFYWVRETCLHYIIIQNICERYSLPYCQFQMLSLYEGWLSGLLKTEKELVENSKNPNFEKRYKYNGDDKDRYILHELVFSYQKFINTKNFLGWPSVEKQRGFTIEEKVILPNHKDNTIGEYDKHPNENGHKQIAEFLYTRLKHE